MDIELAIKTAREWKKGTIHSFGYSKEVKLPKKFGDAELRVNSSFQARVGIDYDNIAKVGEARAEGHAKGGLSGVEQVEEDFLFKGKDGKTLLRVYPVSNGNSRKEYVLNGETKTADELLSMGFAKSLLGIRKEGGLSGLAIYLDPAKITAMN